MGVVVVESEETGGTMHTVSFAERQYRRLACYYSKVPEIASGNRMIVEKGIGEALGIGRECQVFSEGHKRGEAGELPADGTGICLSCFPSDMDEFI